jgi:hypothetical protein
VNYYFIFFLKFEFSLKQYKTNTLFAGQKVVGDQGSQYLGQTEIVKNGGRYGGYHGNQSG